MSDPSRKAGVWMLASSLSFATMGALAAKLGPNVWLVVATSRVAVMFIVAAVIVRLRGERLVFLNPPTLWLRSLAGSFNMICNFYALSHMPLADAVTLFNVNPIWILVLSAIFLKYQLQVTEVACVAIGILGVVLIEQPHVAVRNLAALVALASSFSTAVAMLGLHRLKGVSPWAVVAHFAMVSTVISSFWLLLQWGKSFDPSLLEFKTLALLAGVGVVGTIGQILLTKAYAAGAPSRVAVIGLMQVVFALFFEVLIWTRTPSVVTLLGFLCVLAPSAWLLTHTRAKPVVQEALEG